MAYEGEYLNACGTLKPDFSDSHVVAVSGSGPNVCGHLLFHAGLYHFHVGTGDQLGGIRGYPRYMNKSGYQRYLKENKKKELRRVAVKISKPKAALAYIEEVMSNRWTWGALPNNCVTFVEEVIQAGGSKWNSASNCPALATAESIESRATRFLGQLDRAVRHQLRVPSH